MAGADKLIIVPGHAAFKDSLRDVPNNPGRDDNWVLQSFQLGEPPFYIEHIRKGAELLAGDDDSVLVFSGGRTRQEAGRWSEAATYQSIAEYYRYWTDDPTFGQLKRRSILEEYARDSFENLSFSLCRFYQLEGHYPIHVTVVGWGFKAVRFDHHRVTLDIPAEAFTYIECNNLDDINGALRGEERTLAQFREAPTGEKGVLAEKRKERNPFNEEHPYAGCPPINIGD